MLSLSLALFMLGGLLLWLALAPQTEFLFAHARRDPEPLDRLDRVARPPTKHQSMGMHDMPRAERPPVALHGRSMPL